MVVGSFKIILTPMENIMVARDLVGDRKRKYL
jgi:succinate dehydrogenase/fumarate reductase-like Fe-S protein